MMKSASFNVMFASIVFFVLKFSSGHNFDSLAGNISLQPNATSDSKLSDLLNSSVTDQESTTQIIGIMELVATVTHIIVKSDSANASDYATVPRTVVELDSLSAASSTVATLNTESSTTVELRSETLTSTVAITPDASESTSAVLESTKVSKSEYFPTGSRKSELFSEPSEQKATVIPVVSTAPVNDSVSLDITVINKVESFSTRLTSAYITTVPVVSEYVSTTNSTTVNPVNDPVSLDVTVASTVESFSENDTTSAYLTTFSVVFESGSTVNGTIDLVDNNVLVKRNRTLIEDEVIICSVDDMNYIDIELEQNNKNTSVTTVKKLTARANYGLRIFAGVFTITIITASVVGNTLTIICVARSVKIRTIASYFLVSLCASDMIYSICAMPFFAVRYLEHDPTVKDITSRLGLCTFIPLIQYMCLGASLMSLGLISVNRFVMICFFKFYHRLYTQRNAALMIAGIWILSFSMLAPTLFGRWGKFGYDTKMHYCSIIKDETGTSKYALIGLGFFLPCVSITMSYTGIFIVVRKTENRMREHHRQSLGGGPEPGFSPAEAKLTKMILVVFISFLACFLPNLVIKTTDTDAVYANLQIVSYLLVYLSSCLNPIIYAVTNSQYRVAYLELAQNLRICQPKGLLRVTERRATMNDKTSRV